MTLTIRSRSGVIFSSSVMCFALGFAGCGGAVAFQGQQAFAVTGNSVPAPPAPAPPARKRVNVRNNKIEID